MRSVRPRWSLAAALRTGRPVRLMRTRDRACVPPGSQLFFSCGSLSLQTILDINKTKQNIHRTYHIIFIILLLNWYHGTDIIVNYRRVVDKSKRNVLPIGAPVPKLHFRIKFSTIKYIKVGNNIIFIDGELDKMMIIFSWDAFGWYLISNALRTLNKSFRNAFEEKLLQNSYLYGYMWNLYVTKLKKAKH